MEDGWRRGGGGVEEGWRKAGGRVEEEWRTGGGRVEDRWRRMEEDGGRVLIEEICGTVPQKTEMRTVRFFNKLECTRDRAPKTGLTSFSGGALR